MSIGAEVSGTTSSGTSSTIGTSGSQTSSSTDVLNTINNLVQNLNAQTTQGGTTSDQSTTGASNQNTSGTGTSNTTGTQGTSSTTKNTGTSTTGSSQSSIDMNTKIANNALSNSENTSKTNDLVGNIIKQAAIAFAPTRVQPNVTGSYNNTSTQLLADNAAALATGTAAGAVLNYSTAQQQIAQAAASGLLGATKTTTDNSGTTATGATTNTANTTTGNTSNTNGTTSGNTTGNTTNNQGTATAGSTKTTATVDTLTNLLQTIFSNSTSNTNNSSDSVTGKGSLSLSIICTELRKQGKMSRKDWLIGMKGFAKYPDWGKQGYYLWATPCVDHLRVKPNSMRSKFLERLFNLRAKGFWPARAFVWLLSFTCALYWLMFIKETNSERVLSHD